jgi:hypothetical protein
LRLTKTIPITGLLVGTLDAIAAVIQFKLSGGGNPILIAKFIASGVLGKAAFSGGTGTVLLGILLHYIIAGIWTTIFFVIYPLTAKWSNKYISGILFGLLIWAVMNLVVLPLSKTPSISRDLIPDLIGIGILIIAVGLPVSLIRSRYPKIVS